MAPETHASPAAPPVIALEGIDGAGTTTQLRHLAQWFAQRGIPTVATAQPSRGPVGLLCRQALQARPSLPAHALALLFAADRLEHQVACLDAAAAQGAWVLCDRHLMSSYAYQGLNLPLAWVREINAQARPPTLSLLVEVPVALAQERLVARGGPPEAFDALATQARVAQAYGALARDERLGHPATVVDGTGTEAQVSQRLVQALLPWVEAWEGGSVAAGGFGKPTCLG